jgi:TPR repeat protein
MLGRFFEQGLGGESDLNQAKLWYTKSAKQGFNLASESLANLNK